MKMQTLALIGMVTTAVGGVAWVFLYPLLSGERKAEQRRASVTRTEPAAARTHGPRAAIAARAGRGNPEGPRHQEAEAEKPAAAHQDPAGRAVLVEEPVSDDLGRAGPVRLRSPCSCSAAPCCRRSARVSPRASALPLWILSFLKKRREKKFLDDFPDAVDVIVRGIKAGLPLADSLKMIANEAQEPIKSEFKAIIETQTIGMPLGEACAKLYERMPLPEANFFGIVISIQQKAGGNLSEALGNLSRVLRDRKKMKAKIQAMSMEAKASASIIGALPIAVGVLV